MNQMQMSQIPMGYQMPNVANMPQMAMNNMQNQQKQSVKKKNKVTFTNKIEYSKS